MTTWLRQRIIIDNKATLVSDIQQELYKGSTYVYLLKNSPASKATHSLYVPEVFVKLIV